jgi:branched-chain amino acid transport system substrate-binding protein
MINIKRTVALAITGLMVGAGASHADEVSIGAAISMTGGLAYADVPAHEGMRLAIDEINAAGGIGGDMMITLAVKDGRSDPAQTTIAAQDLLNGGINILITPADSDPSIGAGSIAQSAKIPTFTTVASSPTLPESVGEYMFGNFPGDNIQTTVSAQYAYGKGYRTAVLLSSPDTSYTQLPLYFGEVFKKLGGKVVQEAVFNLGQQDFSSLVTQIANMSERPDVIMTAAYEPDFPAFLKQLRAAGVDTPVIGSDGIDSPTTFSLGAVSEGVVFSTAGFAKPGNHLDKFNKAYDAKYGKAPETIFAALGYDLIKVIEAAVIKAGSLDGATLQAAIASLENVQGATSKITYAGSDRVPFRDVAMVRVSSGERELVSIGMPDPKLVPVPQY